MKIGAISHFGQGWGTSVLTSAVLQMGIISIRDEIYWSNVETEKGIYDFSSSKVDYAEMVIKSGVELNLVFQFGNALYDNGYTPFTDEGRKAFADFIVATLEEYPGVTSIEIGNEYNGNSFVTGPIAHESMSLRDDYYVDLLKVVHDAVSDKFPDTKIYGGATHSIPVAYFEDLFEHGTLDLVDSITIHPYTTPPEQFGDQIDLLKAAMGNRQVPIEVTEFGHEYGDPGLVPAYLVKMTSVMSAAGVASAQWYGLSEEAWYPNMQLLNADGSLAPAGHSFKFVQQELLSLGDAVNVSNQSSAYLYQFGSRALVMWGEDQEVTLKGRVDLFDATGLAIHDFDGRLDPNNPVIAIFKKDIVDGATAVLSNSAFLADSYHDYDVTNPAGGTKGFDGPWSYFEQSGRGVTSALYTMGGGMMAGEAWTPYIGSEWRRPLIVTATNVQPVDFGAGKNAAADYSIVERFTASKTDTVTISGRWDVIDSSVDGVDLHILVNGKEIFSTIVYDPTKGNVLNLELNHVRISKGDTIDFVTGTNATSAGGDNVERRIQIIAEQDLSGSVKGTKAGFHADLTHMTSNVSLAGTSSADTIWGGEDSNSISGYAGRDQIFGGTSNDILNGGNDRDLLKGADGNDILIGGVGADRLFGGAGADIFRFNSLADFNHHRAATDIIFDFEATDNIDLTKLDADPTAAGDQSFSFAAADSFSGEGIALHYRFDDGNTIVEGDVDGDRRADFSLTILGVHDLQEENFQL